MAIAKNKKAIKTQAPIKKTPGWFIPDFDIKWGVVIAGISALLVINSLIPGSIVFSGVVRINLIYLVCLFILYVYASYHNKIITGADKARVISAIVLIGFIAAAAYTYCAFIYWPKPYPDSTFLSNPAEKFSDFNNYYMAFTVNFRGEYQPWMNNPDNLIYAVLWQFFRNNAGAAYAVYGLVFAIGLLVFAYSFIKGIEGLKNEAFIHALIISFFTYPFLFNIDRGNHEMYAFILLTLAMMLFMGKKFILSSAVFAVAALCQPVYAIVPILLFLSEKKYREVFSLALFIGAGWQLGAVLKRIIYPTAGTATDGFNLLLLLFFAACIALFFFFRRLVEAVVYEKKDAEAFFAALENWKNTLLKKYGKYLKYLPAAAALILLAAKGGALYKAVYDNYLNPALAYNVRSVIGDQGGYYSSSLYSALKELLILSGAKIPVMSLFTAYPYIAVCLFAMVLIYAFRAASRPVWEKITVFLLAAILLPFISNDCGLIALVLPLLLFVAHKGKSRLDIFYALLFALIMIPGRYYILRAVVGQDGIVRPVLMTVFLLLLMASGITGKEKPRAKS